MASDRTNRGNAFYQLREIQRAFAGREGYLEGSVGTFVAVVLYADPKTVPASRPITGPSWPGSGAEATSFDAVFGLSGPPKYKIHFRVPAIHRFLPLPPSFRNLVLPGDTVD